MRKKVLFLLSIYNPKSVGGLYLHTREYMLRLREFFDVGVIRHHTNRRLPTELAIIYGETDIAYDNDIPVYQIGVPVYFKPFFRFLGTYYEKTRYVRPFYKVLLHLAIASAISSLVKQYDLLHAILHPPVYTIEIAMKMAKRQGIPFIFTPVVHIDEKGSGRERPIYRRLYRNADALIAMTDFERNWLIDRGTPEERVHVCPPWPVLSWDADPQSFRDRHELGNDPLVLFIGRQANYKGYQYLCNAARIVWTEFPAAHFVFAGPHTGESTRYFSEHKDQRIINLGEVSLEEKTSALAACTVFCVPSSEESLGVVYLEAWSFKKPVIACDLPVLRHIIAHGENGLRVKQDEHEIAKSINFLLGNPSACCQMGETGYKKVISEYKEEMLVQRLVSVYKGLLS